jgi:hypothetical protein
MLLPYICFRWLKRDTGGISGSQPGTEAPYFAASPLRKATLVPVIHDPAAGGESRWDALVF